MDELAEKIKKIEVRLKSVEQRLDAVERIEKTPARFGRKKSETPKIDAKTRREIGYT